MHNPSYRLLEMLMEKPDKMSSVAATMCSGKRFISVSNVPQRGSNSVVVLQLFDFLALFPESNILLSTALSALVYR